MLHNNHCFHYLILVFLQSFVHLSASLFCLIIRFCFSFSSVVFSMPTSDAFNDLHFGQIKLNNESLYNMAVILCSLVGVSPTLQFFKVVRNGVTSSFFYSDTKICLMVSTSATCNICQESPLKLANFTLPFSTIVFF